MGRGSRRCALLAVPLAALALVAAGCGGGSDDGDAGATSVAATTEPTVASAAQEFRELTDTTNATLTDINARIQAADAGSDWDGLADAFDDYAATLATARTGLLAIDFPDAVRDEADGLIASAEKTRLVTNTMAAGARARTLSRAGVQVFVKAITELSGRSTALRVALGLPPAPKAG
jgi:hypothetical protein